jgi:hypothetical protein
MLESGTRHRLDNKNDNSPAGVIIRQGIYLVEESNKRVAG